MWRLRGNDPFRPLRMLLDEGADLLRVVPNSGLLDYWNIQAKGLIKTSPDNLRVETQSAGGGEEPRIHTDGRG